MHRPYATSALLDSRSSILHDNEPPSEPPKSASLPQVPFVPPPQFASIPNITVSGQEWFLSMAIDSTPPTASGLLANPYSHPRGRAPIPDIRGRLGQVKDSRSFSLPSVGSCMDLPQLPRKPVLNQINSTLRKDLEGNTLYTTTKFLDQLLPSKYQPFTVDESLLEKLSLPTDERPAIWNVSTSCFHEPPKNFMEYAVCEWLNMLGNAMGLVYNCKSKRLWWSGYNKPLPRPNLVLLNRGYHDHLTKSTDRINWASVKAFAEVLSQKATPPQMTESINAKSYLVFNCQPHRRFTIALSFIKGSTPKFSLTVTDRIGQVRIKGVDLLVSAENGILLLTILAFLMYGTAEDIGLDSNCDVDSNGEVIAITCDNRRYEIVERIYALESLIGRATQVWVVRSDGVNYVMKDSWIREDRTNSEIDHLRKMLEHDELKGRVPTFIAGGDVYLRGTKDCTRSYRGDRFSKPHTHRVHRRLVISPVGKPITSMKSKKEFISAIINIINTHRYLSNRVGILHGDLSMNNVMLSRSDDESEACGLLIDFDYAVNIPLPQADATNRPHSTANSSHVVNQRSAANASRVVGAPNVSIGESDMAVRTGTPPYMAIEALLSNNTNFVHKPKHDLESILYIILYVCTYIQGPRSPLSLLEMPSNVSFPIRTWFSKDKAKEIGYRKLAHIECFNMAIIPKFTPYWADFVPFIQELIAACFPNRACFPNEFNYQQALEILERAYHTVQEPSEVRVGEVGERQMLKRQRDASSSSRKKGKTQP